MNRTQFVDVRARRVKARRRSKGRSALEDLAGIEYHGLQGITRACRGAVIRLIQCREPITAVRILSCERRHCLLLTIGPGEDRVAIKSGFGSGYSGEGSHGLSYVLQLLENHGAEIEEVDVDKALFERLERSALTSDDLERIDSARPVRPQRWHEYMFEGDWDAKENGRIWWEFEPVIPYAIIDGRLTDLSLAFWDDPDAKLVTGYRRLEDLVRAETGLTEYGSQLMSAAFLGDKSVLCWPDISEAEQRGRGNLFTGAFMAHRNPRAHQELRPDTAAQLRELLLLNHLYALERESSAR